MTKFIQIIDGADNCVYDIYSCSDDDFSIIFPEGTDVGFAEDFGARQEDETLSVALDRLWKSRVKKVDVRGIHGTLFYGLEQKRIYYPTLRDEEAANPNGSKIRP